ncbi:hypothetical protein [Vibrio caribbeanicus]|uniref:Uncharacterized protein n=1 Tax=Vibrio caribbeanicus ATCC BAA-2122 TaxID=796620 RepID=E3BJZ9_9VIBR|nr:hypothetical protein [Vibrio caribbeanicus]EFP96627.1 hypothetical protein VIBC2010_09892 [Vibrio caribbeanicus ATCC BAA-2122]
MSQLDELNAILNNDLSSIEEGFNATYKKQLDTLSELSFAELHKINPDININDLEALYAVVQEASQQNLSQALLKERITQLGDTALEIAKVVDIIV